MALADLGVPGARRLVSLSSSSPLSIARWLGPLMEASLRQSSSLRCHHLFALSHLDGGRDIPSTQRPIPRRPDHIRRQGRGGRCTSAFQSRRRRRGGAAPRPQQRRVRLGCRPGKQLHRQWILGPRCADIPSRKVGMRRYSEGP